MLPERDSLHCSEKEKIGGDIRYQRMKPRV